MIYLNSPENAFFETVPYVRFDKFGFRTEEPLLNEGNAKDARIVGQKPIKEWSKEAILKAVSDCCEIGMELQFDPKLLQNIPLTTLQRVCLQYAASYKVGRNDRVRFYTIDRNVLPYLTEDYINSLAK